MNFRKKKIKVSKIILYGSYAKGNIRSFSDIDIAVISPDFIGKDRLEIQEMIALASSRGGISSAIEPIGFSTKEYKDATPTTFLGEIKKTGRMLYG